MEDLCVHVLFRVVIGPGRPAHDAGDVVIVVGAWAGGGEVELCQQCLEVCQDGRREGGGDVAARAVLDEAVCTGRREPNGKVLDPGG